MLEVPVLILQRNGATRNGHRQSRSMFDTTTLTRSPPKHAILIGRTFDANLRRAGLDVVERLKKGTRRASSVVESNIELHVVLVKEKPSTSVCETKSAILSRFQEAKANVHLHSERARPVSMLSMAAASSGEEDLAPHLRRVLAKKVISDALAKGEVSAVALVNDSNDDHQDTHDMMRELADCFSNHSATSLQPPPITLYVPERPTSGDFDLDLPRDEIASLQIAESAISAFATGFGLAPHQSERGHMRNTSGSILRPVTPSDSCRPFALRPAPTPGAQSVVMRLGLDTGRDLVVRVKEAQTPIEGRSPWQQRTSSDTASIMSSETRDEAIRLRPLLLKPNASPPQERVRSAMQFARSPRLGLVIPPSSPKERARPPPSCFSSPSDNEEETRETTAPMMETPIFDSRGWSPIDKVSLRPGRTDTLDDESLMTPHTRDISGLLWLRMKRAENALPALVR